MKQKIFYRISTLSFFLYLTLMSTSVYAEVKPVRLTDADCYKCHPQAVDAVKGQESAHKNDIGCLDCHLGHPPMTDVVIPMCSVCHSPEENRHFAINRCIKCHVPHSPVIVDFTSLENPNPACITCHEGPGKDFKDFPGAHSSQQCSNCHEKHGLGEGMSYTCLDCHEKHSPDLQLSECTICHKPHKPAAYIWPQNLQGKYCGLCHEDIVTSYTEHGGIHKQKLDCVNCHKQHPPREQEVIPSCNDCHKKASNVHFTVEGCVKCHNPHEVAKLDISHVDNVKPACVSCHPTPGKLMEESPSGHSEQDCNSCHQEHGEFMECSECHEPHSESMQYSDCLMCHEHHRPSLLEINKKTPSVLCGSCHQDQNESLEKNSTLHGKLTCVYCHRRKHGIILECVTCHGRPHPAMVHRKFPDCHQCHGNPHNLRK